MNLKNDEKVSRKAVFRYSIISPLIAELKTNPLKNKAAFFRDASNQLHYFDNMHYQFSAATIKKWYIAYTKKGYFGLEDRSRNRKKKTTKVSQEVYDQILVYLDRHPKITATQIYKKLYNEGYISTSKVSYVTISRSVRKAKIQVNYPQKHRLAWEKALANDCWQSDTIKGPKLKKNGKEIKTYIISIIDDASRLIVASDVYFNDNAMNFQQTLKKAISCYGIPKSLYLDNGSPYNNRFTPQICAKLGINLVFCKPGDSAAKGKIERVQKTIKNAWITAHEFIEDTLERVNNQLHNYIDSDYNTKNHSALTKHVSENEIEFVTPYDRFLKDIEHIRYATQDDIDQAFIFRVIKTISKVSTFRLNKIDYEVHPCLIGEKVFVMYSIDYQIVYVMYGDKKFDVKKVNRVANSATRRQAKL